MSSRIILTSILALTGVVGTSFVSNVPMFANLESTAVAQTSPVKKELVKLNLIAADLLDQDAIKYARTWNWDYP